MKLLRAAALVALSALASGFQPAAVKSAVTTTSSSVLSLAATTEGTPCDTPDIAIPEGVTANVLRSAVLTNVDGQKVQLGDKMGSGTSIVIFLRHMG